MTRISAPSGKVPPQQPQRLTTRQFDVLIIGGGINGAGLARDLSLRGLAVALVDKGDFASGTSSASTKLVHGGIRYLEQFNLRLVFEACRERRILQQIAPHLVQPLPFFIPVYAGDPRPLWMVRAGMLLYDTLAAFRNTHRHSILGAAAALRREPVLDAKGLKGVALYWDCRMDDARLCLENVIAAMEAGAEVANYVEATGLLYRQGRVCGARLLDRESGAELEVAARIVVNAAGPWLDQVCALDGEPPGKLRLTRGSHILVPRINRGEEALYLTAGSDGRLFFVIPWGELSLIGTTDVDYAADPDRVAPVAADIDYLLAECSRHLRQAAPRRSDVVAAFAGLRPLVAEAGGKASRVSREHHIFQSPSGLLSIGGGKYTTYRAVAAEVGERVAHLLGRGQGAPATQRLPLPGGAVGDLGVFLGGSIPRVQAALGVSPATAEGLARRYGARIEGLLVLAASDPTLREPVCPGSSLLGVEVAYAIDCELARTPEDVLRRRTSLALEPGRGLQELAAVTALLRQRLPHMSSWLDQSQREYHSRYSHL